MSETPLTAIIGRPNVGKSTLFNRLAGRRLAVESEESGTTRDRIYAPVSWGRSSFILIDTAGLGGDGERPIEEQAEIAIEEADLVLFVVDGSLPLTAADLAVAERLRRRSTPAIMVANKADRGTDDVSELLRLGFGDPVQISAIHGRGSGELLDRIVQALPPSTEPPAEPTDQVTVSLIGRPNVGKSTLLNHFIPTRRALVSDRPGTTRDYVEGILEHEGRALLLIDTAGIRRRGRIEPGIEQWSVLRSLRALDRSQVVLLLIDATEGPTATDAHLAGLVKDAGKGLIIVINKWDLADPELSEQDFTRRLRAVFDFIPFAPFLFISALEGAGTEPLLRSVIEIAAERSRTIPQTELDDFLSDVTAEKRPHGTGSGRVSLTSIRQKRGDTPTFALTGRGLDRLHFSYRRYLENQLRAHFGFSGTALILELQEDRHAPRRRTR